MASAGLEPPFAKRIRARAIVAGVVLATATGAGAGAGCSPPPSNPGPGTGTAAALVTETVLAMGSSLTVSIWTNRAEAARAAQGAVVAEFERLEALLSVWREGSDVQRLNAAAGGAPVAVGADTMAVLETAVEASRLTGGAFDITFGALADVWRFDHDQDGVVPSEAAIAERLTRVDHRAVVLDPEARTAAITRPGVRVHLGGIGKGYAVDRAVRMLHDAGFDDFLIQAGGDLYAAGRRGDRPWRVGLQDPRGAPDESFATIELADETFSTSGDYERFFVRDGVRYHHLLDPRTGRPARGCRSVTIVARSALVADWLSTGVFIMGPEAGLALVESLPDAEAVVVTAANEVRWTRGLEGRLSVRGAPSP